MAPPPEIQHVEENFIVVNALDTIRAKPRGVEGEEPRYVCKPEYGQVPKYLTAAKLKIQNEKLARERAEALKIQQVCHCSTPFLLFPTITQLGRTSAQKHHRQNVSWGTVCKSRGPEAPHGGQAQDSECGTCQGEGGGTQDSAAPSPHPAHTPKWTRRFRNKYAHYCCLHIVLSTAKKCRVLWQET